MSILLESLNQPQNSEDVLPNSDVPSVEDSHFDDEMLSDEWILKKLLLWKFISALLLLILLASWVGFYFYPNNTAENLEKAPIFKQQKFPDSSKNKPIMTTDIEHASESLIDLGHNAETDVESEKIVSVNASELEQNTENIKQKYQPKKLKLSTGLSQVSKKQAEATNSQLTSPPTFLQKEAEQTSETVEFESLTELEKQQLPELEISSYAVSSNVDKSFVVLNGAFYGQGETIAPHLVLVLIDKEGILIRYKGKLIRKKYTL